MSGPDIISYASADPAVPAALRCAARILVRGPNKKTPVEFLPVIFHAETEEDAAEKATNFYTDQLLREEQKAANIAAGIAKRAAAKLAPVASTQPQEGE